MAQIEILERKSLRVQHVLGLLLGINVGLLAFRLYKGGSLSFAIIVSLGVHYVVYYRWVKRLVGCLN